MKNLKNLVLAAAILTAGISTYATSDYTDPIDINCAIQDDDFVEIELSELKEEITKAVSRDYPSAILSKGYVNKSLQYKLELTTNGTESTLYIDEKGSWLEETDIISEEK